MTETYQHSGESTKRTSEALMRYKHEVDIYRLITPELVLWNGRLYQEGIGDVTEKLYLCLKN